MYRSETRLVEELLATNPELAGLAGAGDVATYLKARDMVVVCGYGTLAVEDAAGETADHPVAGAAGAEGKTAAPTDGPLREQKTSGASPTDSVGWISMEQSPSRNGRGFEKGQVSQKPIRSCDEREDRYGV